MLMLIEGLPEILLFQGFSETSFKGKLIWIAVYPLALIMMFLWWAYTKYVHIYISISNRKGKQ